MSAVADAGLFLRRFADLGGTPRPAELLAGSSAQRKGTLMLGRHVYRVHPTEDRWTVTKEGEEHARGAFPGREEAIAEAVRLAGSDEPAKVTVDNGDGTIAENGFSAAIRCGAERLNSRLSQRATSSKARRGSLGRSRSRSPYPMFARNFACHQLADVSARLCRLLRDEVFEQMELGSATVISLAEKRRSIDLRLLLTDRLGKRNEEHEYIPHVLLPMAASQRSANQIKGRADHGDDRQSSVQGKSERPGLRAAPGTLRRRCAPGCRQSSGLSART